MNLVNSSKGELREGKIFSILYHIYKNNISGVLAVKTDTYEKKIFIRDKKIIFASSDQKLDTLSDYLLNKKMITKEIYNEATQYMLSRKIRFGRALIEMGYFTYDQIWTWVPAHLTHVVLSFFNIKYGTYRILEKQEGEMNIENIVLDIDILTLIVQGMRHFKNEAFLKSSFETIEHLYVNYSNSKLLTHLDLKPYEIHVFDMVKRQSNLESILKWSELLEIDTMRLLYLFLVLEIISDEKYEAKPVIDCPPEMEPATSPRVCAFPSFEEALKYYNARYEMIYKLMLKEIGPIALSILLKSIEDIIDNLPSYFHKIQLNTDGTINGQLILKALWYHDFDQHINDFLTGLEEILYTEIYAVKKHLGIDCEQQVLKWIKGTGN